MYLIICLSFSSRSSFVSGLLLTLSIILYKLSLFSFFKSPVLAAAPDIQPPYSRISLSNLPILPENPTQLREILQNPPIFYPKTLQHPIFYPPKPRKPHFSLKKPHKSPIFSDFSYFFIKNPRFYRHLTPAALLPYFSLFSSIFRKSSNSRLFSCFSRFLDQKPMKTLFFH